MDQISLGYTFAYSGDSTQLLYLRARYYAPGMGRFLTRDTWMGDYNKPHSLNQWNYTNANPVNYTDPSGHDPWWCEDFATNPAKCIEEWVKVHTIPITSLQTSTPTCTPIPNDTITPALVFLWINNSKWHVPEPSDNRLYKHIDFWFTVTGDDPHNYALVQFLKGNSVSFDPHTILTVTNLGQEHVSASSPEWRIDSLDPDPVYSSDPKEGRWRYKQENNTTYSTYDSPNVPIDSSVSDNFQMCIFKLGEVSVNETNAINLMAKANKCVEWKFEASYKKDGTWIIPELQPENSSPHP